MSSAYSTYVSPSGVGTVILPVAPLSTDQYLRMIDAGILESEKVELIGGHIIPMAPAGPEHTGSVFKLTAVFAPFADRFVMAVQATIVMTEGQVLEPDFALLSPRADRYMTELPRAADVQLVVESSATSLEKDRTVKLPIYASAGIPEYWIVDLINNQLEVYRDPSGRVYADKRILAGDESITPLACPEVKLHVGSLFG
jgi:Uma2 family endonuclease